MEIESLSNRKSTQYLIKLGYLLLSFLVFIGVWALFVVIINEGMNNGIRVLPSPFEVFQTFFHLLVTRIDGNNLLDHVGASLFRVLLGVLYAFFIGVPLGVIIGSSPLFDRILRPMLELLRPIPPIAWIPMAIITFGLGILSSSFVIFVGAFFPIFQNAYDGVHRSNQVYADVARSLGATKVDIALEITLPAIIPNILTGLKVSFGVGWMCVIAAEMMGIDVNIGGIGYFINYMKDVGNYANMMAGMLMIAIVGLGINGIFELIERYILRWTPKKQTEEV
ncbi:hypothetical protein NEF87_003911 [Candidatus Lokiarchaeum ossiferum]|uniref:ABC transmembrane type-1 domain-containing protein n=1 Tax=Candidatus Lokiarchaeum ossiferum TaxID=2951803 RepID=A0ABY6HYH1_9ARCH|nr:hypothetical protein NEF87_003911 [Candidatus Lokiarchaeum sp. B-35]